MTRETYSHEIGSCSFWPRARGGPIVEPTYYTYMAPEPPGFAAATSQPAAASLPEAGQVYLALRCDALHRRPGSHSARVRPKHLQAGATLTGWNRAALEC
jgi:hypothetical protein